MQVDICPTVWYHVPQGVPSGAGYYWVEESGSRDLYQAIRDAVHHHKFGVFSSLLECLPAKVLHHLGSATCRTVVTFDKHGCSALYRLQLLDAGCGVWVPYRCGILKNWSDQGLVTLGFNILGATGYVSSKECQAAICLLCCSSHVRLPERSSDMVTPRNFPVLATVRSWPWIW